MYKSLLQKYLNIMLEPAQIKKYHDQTAYYQSMTTKNLEQSMALSEGRIVEPENFKPINLFQVDKFLQVCNNKKLVPGQKK